MMVWAEARGALEEKARKPPENRHVAGGNVKALELPKTSELLQMPLTLDRCVR